MTSRPLAFVNTNCDRFSRPRSSTRSIAAPRRTQDRTGTRSAMSGSTGQAARWQHSLVVRGQRSRTLSTVPAGPIGRLTRYGRLDPSSGLRATMNSRTAADDTVRSVFVLAFEVELHIVDA